MKKIVREMAFFCSCFPVGIMLGLLLTMLRLLGRVEIQHRERLPRFQRNMVVVSNHPSLLEPALLPALFFLEYLVHPLRFSPWSTPDKEGLYDRWYFFWLRPRAVPIDRSPSPEGARNRAKSFREMIKILRRGGRIIIFPEGGRTCFQGGHTVGNGGKKLGRFFGSVALLVKKADSLVVPVWIDGTETVLPNGKSPLPHFWRGKVIVKIGKPFQAKGGAAEQALLSLADEE